MSRPKLIFQRLVPWKAGWFLLILTWFFTGCSSSNSEPCQDTDVSCTRSALADVTMTPEGSILPGDLIVFDATASVYDDILWYQNDVPIEACLHKIVCSIEFDQPGVFVIKVLVTVEGTSVKSGTKSIKNLEIIVKCGEVGQMYADGILVKANDSECLLMQTSDASGCRASDNYANCRNWFDAASVCAAGISPGVSWYLPSLDELKLMTAVKTNAGFCDIQVQDCAESFANDVWRLPYYYWSSSQVSTVNQTYWAHDFSAGVDSVQQRLSIQGSVRCIRQISLE
ncbi:MAG: hypothetical protein HQM12_05605 [SAR324 cluster bacterium]|nr:hypothetical protein [SAR324 cluster bacterium]